MRTLTLGAAAALLGALVPAPAAAQDVIYACYVPTSGTIYRVADETAECKGSNHVAFHWNVEGPAGDDGADGQDGVSGFEVVEHTQDADPLGATSSIAWCPVGKRAVGGGHLYLPAGGGNDGEVWMSKPTSNDTQHGWRVAVLRDQNIDPENGLVTQVTAYAICVTVTDDP